ncbi:MAG: IS110 family transposase [Bacteroidota bacterium]|nr:IS110 family transposase [Flavobacteriales bacterium]GIK69858.1 MAG: IS110 family transposase [Bacteroidota bacterium]
MIKNRNYVGIDISKKSFDVAIRNEKGNYLHYKFSNDSEGFEKFFGLLNNENDSCVMEASGPYYLRLATFLYEKQVDVSVINPLVIRRFSQMRMMRTKTDKKDAVMIAEYGKTENPKIWEPEETYVLELKKMQAYVEQLNKSRTGFIRQQEAFKQNPVTCLAMNKSITKTINLLEKEIATIEIKMEAIVKEHHQKQFQQLQSIPGLGKKTSMQLIVLSGGFTKFENAKQLSSYVGLSPHIFESGTSVKGKAKICKMGMSRVRAMLYVCAWTAKKCNKACRELYDRLLKNGKAKKLALIAVANKLLKQAFAIATKNEFYVQIN